ncbi:shikimate dehydrogenase family protein [Pararobbsia silviterrae]|uniref:Shikimate dehydrogenase n=1 Tax=Pararobbsia silviterrae TaxID=1792498 RepID=A0A494XZQ6_9BURK|nr:shikimate dehydrogenase [Pararobbsia silviterrae]RKP55997.1 shikimate dehydrogenase [Pararobbsia silviterrae]
MVAPVSCADTAVSLDEGLTGATRVYFVVGDPIAQVRSPMVVTAAMRKAGRDAIVIPVQVAPDELDAFFAGVASMRNVDGVIVTVPHKFSGAQRCASLSDAAAFAGSVNTMRRTPQGEWRGDMSDGIGLIAAMRDGGCVFEGQRALLIGAGGAGSAIGHALVTAGVASLDIRDPDTARTDALVARLSELKRGAVRAAASDVAPEAYDVLINASPLGMREGDPLPIDVSRLRASTFIGDVVTKPPLTPFIEAARARGCKTVTGTQMFARVSGWIVDFLSDPNA